MWEHRKYPYRFFNQTTVLNFISENELYSSFILIPFKEILAELRKDSVLSEAIDIVNNPYWIVRNLYSRYKTRLLRRVKALRRRVEWNLFITY